MTVGTLGYLIVSHMMAAHTCEANLLPAAEAAVLLGLWGLWCSALFSSICGGSR